MKKLEDFVPKYGLHGCKTAYIEYLQKEIKTLQNENERLEEENSDLSWSVPLPPLRHEMGG